MLITSTPAGFLARILGDHCRDLERLEKRNCGAVLLGVHYLLHRTTGRDRVAHVPQDHNQPRCHRILIWVKLCKAADNNIEYCPSLTRGNIAAIGAGFCADKAEGRRAPPR
jgi:hypothetical protein